MALSRERSKEELEDVLQSNLEELERLSTIIKDMLFLSRADQGETATNLSRISLAEEVRRTADFLDVVFEDCQTKLEIEGDAETAADRSLLSRAITNLLKPLSGSGARGLMVDAMTTYGPDSFVGRLACIFQGSTDTTFYILAVYFGSVGVVRTRHAVPCGLLADLAGVIAAILICYLFFG